MRLSDSSAQKVAELITSQALNHAIRAFITIPRFLESRARSQLKKAPELKFSRNKPKINTDNRTNTHTHRDTARSREENKLDTPQSDMLINRKQNTHTHTTPSSPLIFLSLSLPSIHTKLTHSQLAPLSLSAESLERRAQPKHSSVAARNITRSTLARASRVRRGSAPARPAFFCSRLPSFCFEKCASAREFAYTHTYARRIDFTPTSAVNSICRGQKNVRVKA